MTTPSNTPWPSPEPGPAAGQADPRPAAHLAAPQPSAPYGAAPPGIAPSGAAGYGGAPAPVTRPARNALGIVALVLGVIVLLTSSLSLVVQASMMRTGDYAAIGAILGAFALVQGALALAAIACGGIGLALRGRAKGAAGIGLGIGVTALWAVLGGVFYGALVQVLA